MNWAWALLAAYLVGSVSFSYLMVRYLRSSDIRAVGSGNAGATNVLRAAGRLPAVSVLALDIGKGAVPVALAARFGAPEWAVAGAGLAVVLGHVYPIFLGFRGGKGVATAAGALGYLTPLPVLIGAFVFAGAVRWSRAVSAGSVLAVASIPVSAWLCDRLGIASVHSRSRWLGATLVCLLILYKHTDNIRRLRQGTERKLGESAK